MENEGVENVRVRMVKRCTACKLPVRGHVGQCGKKCPKRPFISFQDLGGEADDTEIVYQELENGEEDVESNKSTSSGDETGKVETPARRRHASTPRGNQDKEEDDESVHSIFPKGESELLQQLVSQMTIMQEKMGSLAAAQRSLETEAKKQTVPMYTSARSPGPKASSSGSATWRAGSGTHTIAPQNISVPSNSRSRGRISVLKPVDDSLDVLDLGLQPGISETVVKKALSGEFTPIELFLKTSFVSDDELKYETFFENGQLLVRQRKPRRKNIGCVNLD